MSRAVCPCCRIKGAPAVPENDWTLVSQIFLQVPVHGAAGHFELPAYLPQANLLPPQPARCLHLVRVQLARRPQDLSLHPGLAETRHRASASGLQLLLRRPGHEAQQGVRQKGLRRAGVSGKAGSPGSLRGGEGLYLAPRVRKSRTAFTVSIQRRPIRSMAATIRVSPAVRRPSRVC